MTNTDNRIPTQAASWALPQGAFSSAKVVGCSSPHPTNDRLGDDIRLWHI